MVYKWCVSGVIIVYEWRVNAVNLVSKILIFVQ